jgi:hypothetical protein
LSPLIDRINDRYGRCSIGFGLFPRDVRAFIGSRRLSPGAGEVGVLTACTGTALREGAIEDRQPGKIVAI